MKPKYRNQISYLTYINNNRKENIYTILYEKKTMTYNMLINKSITIDIQLNI